MGIFDIINVPLGYLFRFIFLVVQNYGWTLVLFTIITKAILLPLSVKQQKSMSKMQAIQPRLAELQKKYQYDKEKLNQETMKLYQTNKINPMGGCLPLLIQFPLLIGLYNIIRNPLTYVIQLGKHGLPALQELIDVMTPMGLQISGNVINEIPIAKFMSEHFAAVVEKLPALANVQTIDFNFLGLDLSQTPSLNELSPLLLIPILAGLSTFLSSWLSQKMSGTPKPSSENSTASTMQMMTYIFPFMTVFFAFSLPAGLGLYWIISNIVQLVQQVVLTQYFAKKLENEAPQKEHYRERENKRRKK
mgnify:CR=1 FL=1